MKYSQKHQSTVVAIAGASACGKSYLLRSIFGYLGKENAAHFDMDGYHFHTRDERRKLQEYPEELKANDFGKMIRDVRLLKSGRPVDIPVYDHSRGIFLSYRRLQPKPIIFVEGLHAIKLNELSGGNLIDFTIFLLPEESLRKKWKVKRDINERNYNYEDVIAEIKNRERFVKEIVMPQIKAADAFLSVTLKKSGLLDYRLYLAYAFYNKYLGKSTQSEVFDTIELILENRKYFEIRFNSNNHRLADLLGSVIPRLRTGIQVNRILSVERASSFKSMTKTLIILIFLLMVRESGELS